MRRATEIGPESRGESREVPTRERTGFERDRLALFAEYGFKGEGRRLTNREGRSTYAIEGGDGRDLIVLVHGGLSQAGEWAPLAGLIPGRLVLPDRPGCGLSYPIDYRQVDDYREAAASWLLDLVDGLEAEQIDLVANSMGGFFSIAFALAHPHRVRRLVFVGAPAGIDRHLPLLLRLWGNPIVGPIVTRMRPSDPEVFRRKIVRPMLAAHPERVRLDWLELGVSGAALPGADVGAQSMLRTVSTLGGWRRALMVRDDLAALQLPIKFVWGDRDVFAPPTSGDELAARMADAEVEVIEDAGHIPHLDRADAVAASINEFLGLQRT